MHLRYDEFLSNLLPGLWAVINGKVNEETARNTLATPQTQQLVAEQDVATKLRAELNAKLAELPPEQGGIKFSVNDLTLKAARAVF